MNEFDLLLISQAGLVAILSKDKNLSHLPPSTAKSYSMN